MDAGRGEAGGTAYEAKTNRLLILDTAADELMAIPVGADGSLDPVQLVRYPADHLGAVDPQGLAVDPASGRLFVFDRGGRWLLRVEPDAQGSFASAAVTSVDLSRLDLSDPRGLAFDQTSHLHLLTGTNWTLSELTEEGELVATRDLSGIGLFDPRAMVSPRAGT